jgi:hypothetical protein
MTLAGVGLLALSAAAQAGVTIDIVDNGPDIVVTASGTLNLTALTDSLGNFVASAPGLADFGGDLGTSQGLVLGSPLSAYTLRSGPDFTGPAYPFFGAERPAQTQLAFSNAAGDLISLGYSATPDRVGIAVANTYVNGAPLSASGTWTGLDLARLGVTAGSTYTWTWGADATSDFLTVNVTAIPEPSTAILMLAGLALVGLGARRFRRA